MRSLRSVFDSLCLLEILIVDIALRAIVFLPYGTVTQRTTSASSLRRSHCTCNALLVFNFLKMVPCLRQEECAHVHT